MKKLIIISMFVFAFALTANVAFAGDCGCGFPGCLCPSTSVTNINAGSAQTNATANSYTGANGISKVWGGATISTGAAAATILGTSQANYNDVDVKTGPIGKLSVFNTNFGRAQTNATASAGSGNNGISCAGTSYIGTGTAAAYVQATSVVNTNMIKINRCCSLGCGPACGD